MLVQSEIYQTVKLMVHDYYKNKFDSFLDELEKDQTKDFIVALSGIPDSAYFNSACYVRDIIKPQLTTDHAIAQLSYWNANDIRYYIRYYDTVRPSKALEKAIKVRFDAKLHAKDKEKLGSLLKPVDINLKITFSMGCAGESSEYYHSSSCWWGEYAKSRDYVGYNKGGAIRAYEEDNLVGRVWFLPCKKGIVMFNAYGKGELQHIETWGKIIAQALGMLYNKSYLDLNVDSSDGFYLNSCTTAFVGYVKNEEIRFKLEEPDDLQYGDAGIRCADCGDYVHENNAYYVDCLGDYVCNNCLDNSYQYVDHGSFEGFYPTDDVVYVEHTTRRDNTTHDYYHVDDGDIVRVDGDYYHIDMCVVDEHGNWYLQDSDQYCILDDGSVYPTEECTYNKDTNEWELDN